MSKPFLVFLGLSLAVAGALLAIQVHRDGTLSDARRAADALAAAGEVVRFKWQYESCPPENPSIYAEWTRRLVDAKASSAKARGILGADDPNVQLISTSIFNQEIALSERRVACLDKQGKVFDGLRRAR